MAQSLPPAKLVLTLAISLLLCAATPHASAQDERTAPSADNQNQRDNRDRQSRWTIPDDATSDNNRMLKGILERFPEADTDKDGKLNAAEARVLIEKQRELWRDRGNWRRNRIKPTFDNIKYGREDKQHFDLYLAPSAEPTPLVIYFHGGQFITGDESDLGTLDVSALLDAGISVASIDYRETNEAPFPGPFQDAALAVQFIRFYAEKLNIDPLRIAGHGEEAGGNLALYLALHDDLADDEARKQLEAGEVDDPRKDMPLGPIDISEDQAQPALRTEQSDEPQQPKPAENVEAESVEPELAVESVDSLVLEELIPWETPAIGAMSTRLIGAVARHPIATFDPRAWAQHKLPMNDHERLMTKYLNVRYLEPLNDPSVISLVEQVSPLALISRDDPALLLLSQYEDLPLQDNTVWTILRHHPTQSELIAKAMRLQGNSVTVRYKGMKNDPGTRSIDFLIEKLK